MQHSHRPAQSESLSSLNEDDRRERILAAGAGDDRAIAYTLEAEQVYNGLRRLLGQLSGLLILAETRALRDARDLSDLAAARLRWAETSDNASRLAGPGGLADHCQRLQRAAAHLGSALEAMEGAGLRAEGGGSLATRHLKLSYRLLQSASDSRVGLVMVDMSDACCNGNR